jgi:hypothetical protein
MDKEKMADMSGHREIDRAGSNSEAFVILRIYSFALCRLGQSDSARLSS